MEHQKETSSTGTASPPPEEEEATVEMTQEPSISKEAIPPAKEYLVLRHTGDRSEIKIPYTPGASARIVGRGEGADFRIDYPQVSKEQAVVIFLGSGIYIVDVGRNGIFMKKAADAKREKLPVFPAKPPFPPEHRPKMKDMFGPLQPGMIIQIGNGGPGMDELGGQSFSENRDAEYEIVRGEGSCGVGEHSRKRKDKDEARLSDDRGQKSAAAIAIGEAARKR